MNILSLFDGMSCGQQALQRAGINVDQYFASEIDKFAIQVTMANFPNTVQLGSVVNVDGYSLPKIDILIGGSPCQSFSFAGKRKGMATKDEQEILTLEHYLELKAEGFEFEGQSYLFWEYMRLLNETKPTYFLLENVMMGEKWEKVLSKAIGVKPIMINSALLSAQNRQRLYWTNIGLKPSGLFGDLETTIKQPKDKGVLLKDVLESDVDDKYFLNENVLNRIKANHTNQNDIIVHNMMPRSSTTGKGGSGPLSRADGKTYCLDTGTTNAIEIINPLKGETEFGWHFEQNVFSDEGKTRALKSSEGSGNKLKLYNNSIIRRLTPIECERLQTVADNYTNHVSDSQRYKMLGNGWTVDVIVHILKYINLNQ